MGGSSSEEAMNKFVAAAIKDGAELDERDLEVIDLYFGLSSGVRLNLSQIAAKLGFSREWVRRLMARISKQMGHHWNLLEEQHPKPTPEYKRVRDERRGRNAIRQYLRMVGDRDPLQYVQVHTGLGLPLPAHRRNAATAAMNEVESCFAFMEDYDAKMFGRYRYCTMCKEIQPIDQFYRVKPRGYHWQFCKSCNTKRSLAYAQSKREEKNKVPTEG